MYMVVSPVSPTGDLAHNSGMCLDWELNWRRFGSQPTLNPLSYTSQVGNFLKVENFLWREPKSCQ